MDTRKHINVKFVNSVKLAERWLGHPCYKAHRILAPDLIAVYCHKPTVKMDNLYAVGFSILELSKYHMYSVYYDFLEDAIGTDNMNMLLTDTDSFLIEILNYTRREIWDLIKPIMDFSNYPPEHELYDVSNKAVPGYLKDETPGNIITEVIGLRSKSYIFATKDKKVKAVCKGIAKPAKAKFTMEMYQKCIKTQYESTAKMVCLRATNHIITTREISKIALSSSDDKRHLLRCGIHTLALGHEDIEINCVNGVDESTAFCYICKV